MSFRLLFWLPAASALQSTLKELRSPLEPAWSSVALVSHELAEPNPPAWPPSVQVFDSSMGSGDISYKVESLARRQSLYSSERAALLFKPGAYNVDLPVNYYTQVIGLGNKPADVTFSGMKGVHQDEPGRNLPRFWRGVENLVNRPFSKRMVWSVSQASPLRRMLVDGDLVLGAEADTMGSGGFISNLKVSGRLNFTMQQQWLVRNAELGAGTAHFESPPRSVSFVYVGSHGAPEQTSNCTDSGTNPVSPSPQNLVANVTPVSIEKPYITIDKNGNYKLVTPKAIWESTGAQWDADSFVDDFSRVFVARNTTSAKTINNKLAQGKHVILSPGIYQLDEPIIMASGAKYQVLMGLGLATLVPSDGQAAVIVKKSAGVRVAGILFQAGERRSESLLQVGSSSVDGEASNPCLLADVYARVGGPDKAAVAVKTMLEVNSSHVVMDNVWLWRADIEVHTPRDCDHGIMVNGDNVTAYGLASEHMQSENAIWNGEHGRVYFFQAELDSYAHMPEDKTSDYGPNGVSGYRVNARHHEAHGVGIYVYQLQPGVVVESGIKVLHKEALDGFVCPYKWDLNPAWWANGTSTIKTAIMLVSNGGDNAIADHA